MQQTGLPKRFSELAASQKLKKLAEHPFNLSEPGALTPKRIADFSISGVGFQLLYATEKVTKEVIAALQQLALERNVLGSIDDMQAGKVINAIEGFPSENRSVLHTALRDFFDSPRTEETAREAARLAKEQIDQLKPFLENSKAFDTLVVIGIGGSELGPKALYLALEAFKQPNRHVHFIGNIDPDDTVKVFRGLNLSKTLVCVVSKSGTTLETAVNDAFTREIFSNQGLNPASHFIAVTGKGSPMDNPSHYRQVFHIWDWVGGRYSGSSIIGGVIIGFACSFAIYWEFLKGAHAMDLNSLTPDMDKNIPLMGALLGVWNHNFLNIQTCAIIPYSQALWRFTAHLQQLDMESNGKQIDRQGNFVDHATGPIIWGEAGTNAQHSFFQLIHQGVIPICLEMIGFKENQTGEDFNFQGTTSQEKLLSNLFAQAIALAVGQKNDNPNRQFLGNRPSHILLGSRLTPYSLGSLLSYYENKVAFQGFLWNINSFDQEGVQLGKVLANKTIDRFKAAHGEKSAEYPLADAYLNFLK